MSIQSPPSKEVDSDVSRKTEDEFLLFLQLLVIPHHKIRPRRSDFPLQKGDVKINDQVFQQSQPPTSGGFFLYDLVKLFTIPSDNWLEIFGLKDNLYSSYFLSTIQGPLGRRSKFFTIFCIRYLNK